MTKLYIVLQRKMDYTEDITVYGPFMTLSHAEEFEHDAWTPGFETCIRHLCTRNTVGVDKGSNWKE